MIALALASCASPSAGGAGARTAAPAPHRTEATAPPDVVAQVASLRPVAYNPYEPLGVPRETTVFVPSEDDNAVYVFRGPGPTPSLVKKIPAGKLPHNLAMSPDQRWVAVPNRLSADVTIIDAEELREVARVKVDRAPHDPLFSPDGRQLWVAIGNLPWPQVRERIYIVDMESRRVIKKIDTGRNSHDLMLSADGMEVWLSNSGIPSVPDSHITVMSVAEHRVLADIDSGSPSYPFHAPKVGKDAHYVNPEVREIWFSDRGGKSVIGFDLKERKKVAEIPTGVAPFHISYAPGGILYVANNGSDTVSVVDTAARKVIGTLDVKTPHGMRCSSPRGRGLAARALIGIAAFAAVAVLGSTTTRAHDYKTYMRLLSELNSPQQTSAALARERAAAAAALEALRPRLAAAEARYAERDRAAQATLRFYESYAADGIGEILFAAPDLDDWLTNLDLLRRLVAADLAALEEARRAAREVYVRRRALDSQAASVDAIEATLEDRRQVLELLGEDGEREIYALLLAERWDTTAAPALIEYLRRAAAALRERVPALAERVPGSDAFEIAEERLNQLLTAATGNPARLVIRHDQALLRGRFGRLNLLIMGRFTEGDEATQFEMQRIYAHGLLARLDGAAELNALAPLRIEARWLPSPAAAQGWGGEWKADQGALRWRPRDK